MTTNEDWLFAAISWANKRLAHLGLGNTVCVVHTCGAARVLSASGRELHVVDGDPVAAVVVALARVEAGLESLLKGV